MAKDDSMGGCGCIFVILIIISAFITDRCKGVGEDTSQQTTTEQKSYSSDDYAPCEEVLSAQEKLYLDNRLATGDTPYEEYYGSNYMCTRNQCSAIEVTAPDNSDIVMIIKRDNENGRVISHAYIRAGSKYTLDLPNGIFQPFFYYGEGWNPKKDMGNGVKGGFVRYESFSKDNPQDINDFVLSYVLKLQRDGNFQTKSSSRGEMF